MIIKYFDLKKTNLDKYNLIKLFNSVNSNNLKLLFDTGNRITNPNNNYSDIISLFTLSLSLMESL